MLSVCYISYIIDSKLVWYSGERYRAIWLSGASCFNYLIKDTKEQRLITFKEILTIYVILPSVFSSICHATIRKVRNVTVTLLKVLG